MLHHYIIVYYLSQESLSLLHHHTQNKPHAYTLFSPISLFKVAVTDALNYYIYTRSWPQTFNCSYGYSYLDVSVLQWRCFSLYQTSFRLIHNSISSSFIMLKKLHHFEVAAEMRVSHIYQLLVPDSTAIKTTISLPVNLPINCVQSVLFFFHSKETWGVFYWIDDKSCSIDALICMHYER